MFEGEGGHLRLAARPDGRKTEKEVLAGTQSPSGHTIGEGHLQIRTVAIIVKVENVGSLQKAKALTLSLPKGRN